MTKKNVLLPKTRRGLQLNNLLALLSNIRLGWKWLTVTDTTAYYGTELITAVKGFMVEAACVTM